MDKSTYNVTYYQKNKDKLKRDTTEYRKKHLQECKQRDAKRYLNNKEKLQKQARARYWQNRKKILEQKKEKQAHTLPERKAYMKEWNEKNKEQRQEQQQKYVARNKVHLRTARRKRNAQRRRDDPFYRFCMNIRRRCHLAFLGKAKPATTVKLIGCTFEAFKEHIAAKFQPGMSWENYGEWHIDHIIPLASANGDTERVRQLLHYLNTQPLWARDNFKKNKY